MYLSWSFATYQDNVQSVDRVARYTCLAIYTCIIVVFHQHNIVFILNLEENSRNEHLITIDPNVHGMTIILNLLKLSFNKIEAYIILSKVSTEFRFEYIIHLTRTNISWLLIIIDHKQKHIHYILLQCYNQYILQTMQNGKINCYLSLSLTMIQICTI